MTSEYSRIATELGGSVTSNVSPENLSVKLVTVLNSFNRQWYTILFDIILWLKNNSKTT